MGPGSTFGISSESCARVAGEMSVRVEDAVRSCGVEQVHDLRVAIRRFSQVLWTFESCYPRNVTKKIARRLKKAMRLAGRVRNFDIAMQYAAKWRLTDQHHLEGQREEAAHELTSMLKKWSERGYGSVWVEQLTTGRPEMEPIPVQEHARGLLSAMAARFFSRGNEAAAPGATAGQMHGFRIAAKRFRYTMELFAADYGPVLEARIKQVLALQKVLGDVNDFVTLRGILWGTIAAGKLRKKQRRKLEEFRGLWKSSFSSGAVAREWVQGLALLSVRKGPWREPSYRREAVTGSNLGQGRRRRAAGGG